MNEAHVLRWGTYCQVLISKVRVYRRPTQVQLMRGEFLKTALYWAGVVPVRLGAIAERRSVSIPVSGVQCEFDSQSISCFIWWLELS